MDYRLDLDSTHLTDALRTFELFRGRLIVGALQSHEHGVAPKDEAPILRESRGDEGSGQYILESRRYGLVPQGFASTKEADRYEKWTQRWETWKNQRHQSELFNRRCLIPLSSVVHEHLSGTTKSNKNAQSAQIVRVTAPHPQLPLMAAGIYATRRESKPTGKATPRFLTTTTRSFALLTNRSDSSDPSRARHPIILPEETWALWLDSQASSKTVLSLPRELERSGAILTPLRAPQAHSQTPLWT